MKIAICLHGLSGGMNSKGRRIKAEEGYQCIKEHFLDKYPGQIDVFMHSWTPEAETKMIDLYQPISYKFEPQKRFSNPKEVGFEPTFYKNMHSLYYSYRCVNQLKKKYEEEQGFIYDWVIHSRFDLSITKAEIDFNTLNKTKIYFTGYQQKRLLDHLWISSSKLMDKFIEVFKLIHKYEAELKHCGSNYQFLNHDVIFIHAKHQGLLKHLKCLPQNSFIGGTFPQKNQ